MTLHFAAMLVWACLGQPVDAPKAKPETALDKLAKTRSIDALRAKFFQCKTDDERDDVRAAIMTVVSDVFQDRLKDHIDNKRSGSFTHLVDWPEYQHRGYVDLEKKERRRYCTLYGRQLDAEAFSLKLPLITNQLIIAAGAVDATTVLMGCVVVCDSFSGECTETIVIASSNIHFRRFITGLGVSNGAIDCGIVEPFYKLYTRGDIDIRGFKMNAKTYLERVKAPHNFTGEGKIADTGLTFFQLADLGLVCKLDADKAVVVESVKVGSPAEVGKLKIGDVIKRVNDRPVKVLDKVEELFRYAMMDGPKAKVTVTRSKQSLDLEILFP